MPTRATPTIGLAFESMHTIGSTVKPMARRSGLVTSSPLQMVGVSHCASTSRSDGLNARSAMMRLLDLPGTLSPEPVVCGKLAPRGPQNEHDCTGYGRGGSDRWGHNRTGR